MFETAFALVAAVYVQQTNWPIGVEREVDEGVYMQVVAEQQGWRVWRSESRNGVICKAVKSAKGKPHPVPVGVMTMLHGGTPFLNVTVTRHGSSNRPQYAYSWRARHYGKVSVKMRAVGARFYDDVEPTIIDGKRPSEGIYQVSVTSWEYPEILIGHVEETVEFDMTGIGWAEEQVLECQDSSSS